MNMNPLDDQLERLLRAAAAKREVAPAPPYGLETRVMAAWRESGSPGLWTTALLVKGLILAGIVMGLSLLPVLSQTSTPDSEYLQLADSTLQVDSNP